MKIGIDFDNTIVSYEKIFHEVAVEQKLIPSCLPLTKVAVRDYLRKTGQEAVWTNLQGYVYGERLLEADAFLGVKNFLRWARRTNIEIYIVSHKTKQPFSGYAYDLHYTARKWIDVNLRDDRGLMLRSENIYFELTKAEKLARIGAIGIDYFIDDLPEILNDQGFPSHTFPILFDPSQQVVSSSLASVSNWKQLLSMVEILCSKSMI